MYILSRSYRSSRRERSRVHVYSLLLLLLRMDGFSVIGRLRSWSVRNPQKLVSDRWDKPQSKVRCLERGESLAESVVYFLLDNTYVNKKWERHLDQLIALNQILSKDVEEMQISCLDSGGSGKFWRKWNMKPF